MGIISINKQGEGKRILCRTENVCAGTINIILDKDDRIEDLIFVGGCQGNARAVNKLVKGMSIEDVIEKLDGVICGNKGTSCTDQLAQCLKEYLNK